MGEIMKMMVVLTLISVVSGVALGTMNEVTRDPIIQAEFKFAKEPALKEILPEYDNDLVADKFEIVSGEKIVTVYPAKQNGKVVALGYESSAKGVNGDIRIMVGIDLEKNVLRGIRVVAHSETPGLGARITEAAFSRQFDNIPLGAPVKVKPDGGQVDAISGATISSRGTCEAVEAAFKFFEEHKAELSTK